MQLPITPDGRGGSFTIAERLVGKNIIANVRETGATILIAVPILFDKIRSSIEGRLRELRGAKRPLVAAMRAVSTAAFRALGLRLGRVLFASLRSQAGLDSLRLWVSGGGPLSPTTAEFYEVFGFTIVQGYGMSENGPLISTNTVRYRDNRSVGLPVMYTDVRIHAPDRQGIGEIQVRSPSLMKGYYRNEEATREIMTEDGYLRTGDLGRIDRRGFLFITGRSKNLIVTAGGKNVYPEEVEGCFGDAPGIAQILIMGRRASRTDNAEEVVAVCYPDYERIAGDAGLATDSGGIDASTVPEAQVAALVRGEVDRVNRTLPGYKKIVDLRIRKEPFEQTASGKIKRYLYKSLEEAVEG